MIVIMTMGRIILRGNVGNSNNQPYFANGLTVIVFTFVLRSCNYSLMKSIQLFVSHYSTLHVLNLTTETFRSVLFSPIQLEIKHPEIVTDSLKHTHHTHI